MTFKGVVIETLGRVLVQVWADSGCSDRVAQLDVQLAQLLLVDRAGRLREQTLGALGLGESDHVADGLGLGHQRDQAVQTEGQATVRGRAVLQCVQQETELELGFFGCDLQSVKHFLLHVSAVDTLSLIHI